ncbi:Dyp-type peroxidase family [Shewanella halifaxensis HAW-EB4]|uniref:Dyp-type peroxidase family n=1 Tax=Shewanella halifaxensis (strain HAW-EB4) TaxID=458817 RepID=B0TJ67_SHEHH|nr:Dyp-type peroxidase [Shewanella halifaxensis]ABZ75658.1 Dyp-type peroxidase family [Shewanella halifaxensis HAW-EB4]
MTQLCLLAQSGVLSNPTSHVEYLTFCLKAHPELAEQIGDCIAAIIGIEKSINQKDLTAGLNISIGFSANAWPQLFPEQPMPAELHVFPAMSNGERLFPSTAGDIFVMIKSERIDLNFQAAKYIRNSFEDIATLSEDIQGYKYLDNRDMIDFVDGTENPTGNERTEAVLVAEDVALHQGGSYLHVQRYIDRQGLWDKQSTEYQEQVVGRTKMDNVELTDDVKPAWAHNAKSKVEIDGEEIKMLRQNRPYGNAMEHGTMFVGFAATPSIIETSLSQMINADENGHYDRLLDFVEAKTGCLFFMPSKTFIEQFDDE